MAIRYIKYTKAQIQNMIVSGYSLYVDGNYWCMHDSITDATKEADKYKRYNDVEIYPVLKKETRTMSKVKEQMVQEQQDEFELELSYQEWLRDNIDEPSEDELNEMEHDLINKPYFVSNRIITHKSLNNPKYNPILRA